MALVDINTATKEELSTVDGLGESLAEAIIKHRETKGPFASVDGLLAVEGISDRLLAKLRDQLTVSAPVNESVVVLLTRPGGAAGDFTGHSVELTGARTAPDTGAAVPFAAAGATTATGDLTLAVPPRVTLVGTASFRVLAPDGTILATRAEAGPTLPQKVTIEVEPKVFGTTQPNTDPNAGAPTRLRGQVIDDSGKRVASGLQVVIWGATVANPTDADFRALLVVTTDARGHFTGPYPAGTFSAAHATVGVDDDPVTVPVHLTDERFPESVILVIDLPEKEEDEDDCACKDGTEAPRSPDREDLARADGTFSTDAGAGRCVDFTKPDRTLEEYSFTYVVRTTEPEIRGLTLEPPRKVPGHIVDKFLPGLIQEAAVIRGVRDPSAIRAALSGVSEARIGRAGEVVRGDTDDTDDSGAARDTFSSDAIAAALPANLAIDANVLANLTRDPGAVTTDRIASAARLSLHADLHRFLSGAVAREPGRRRLNADNAIQWDGDLTTAQATTIAHGHVLRFKQEWVADGYSMGNLLYSLPLAPGQKKQLAVVDWERREVTSREESRTSVDRIDASLDRDRDISEIVSATLSESTRGGSSASTGGFGGGLGVAGIFGSVGGLLGIGGGFASADSDAWQNSSRKTSANALNQLRDRTTQSASSVRSQRTSVVHTVAQGERVTATTESVANYNHCHAITIQYFEVLRHLLVRQRLADVQECLLVPMLMSWFTRDKTLRWRNTLAGSVSRQLRGGFDALERIDAWYVGSDLPLGRYADENLETVEGDLTIRFQLTRPRDKDEDFDAEHLDAAAQAVRLRSRGLLRPVPSRPEVQGPDLPRADGPAHRQQPGLRPAGLGRPRRRLRGQPQARPDAGLRLRQRPLAVALAADDLEPPADPPGRHQGRPHQRQARAARPAVRLRRAAGRLAGDRGVRLAALPHGPPLRRAVPRRLHPQRPDRLRRRTHRDAAEPAGAAQPARGGQGARPQPARPPQREHRALPPRGVAQDERRPALHAARRLRGTQLRRPFGRERRGERARRHRRQQPDPAGGTRLPPRPDLQPGRREPDRPARALRAEHPDRAVPGRDPHARRVRRGRDGCLQLLRGHRRDPVLALGGVADPGLPHPAAAGLHRHPSGRAGRRHADRAARADHRDAERSGRARPDRSRCCAEPARPVRGVPRHHRSGGHPEERRGRAAAVAADRHHLRHQGCRPGPAGEDEQGHRQGDEDHHHRPPAGSDQRRAGGRV